MFQLQTVVLHKMLKNAFLPFFYLLLFSCSQKEKTLELPQEVLNHQKMVALITDIEITQGYLKIHQAVDDSVIQSKAYKDKHYLQIFNKHGVSAEQFNQSVAFYSNHPVAFEKIYADVITAISEEQANYHK